MSSAQPAAGAHAPALIGRAVDAPGSSTGASDDPADRLPPGAMRRVRAWLLGLLLTGSLFPPVGGVPLNAVAAVLAAPLIAFEFVRALPRLHPILVIVCVMFAPLLLARAWQDAPGGAYGDEKFTTLWTATLLCAAGAALIRDRRALLTFARVWVTIGAILAVTTMFFGVHDGNDRAVGFGSNPIWLGRAMATAAIFCAWLLWRHRIQPVLGWTLLGVVVGGVLLTGSRGPTLGMIFGLLVLAVLASRRPVVLALSAVGGLVLAFWIVPLLWPGIADLRALSFLYGVDLVRGEMWRRTIEVIATHPVGVGYGRWNIEVAPWLPFRYPHNLFLEAATEAGWVAAGILALTTVVVALRLSLRARRDTCCSVLLAVLIAATVAVNLSGDINARTFFAMLALGYWTLHMPADVSDRVDPAPSDPTAGCLPPAGPARRHNVAAAEAPV